MLVSCIKSFYLGIIRNLKIYMPKDTKISMFKKYLNFCWLQHYSRAGSPFVFLNGQKNVTFTHTHTHTHSEYNPTAMKGNGILLFTTIEMSSKDKPDQQCTEDQILQHLILCEIRGVSSGGHQQGAAINNNNAYFITATREDASVTKKEKCRRL